MAPRLPVLLCALACTALRAVAQSVARSQAAASARADSTTFGVCLVSSNADAGAGSLRAALADPSCTSIVIAAGTTIVLQSQLEITHSAVISCNAAADSAPLDLWNSIGGGGGQVLPKCIIDGAGATRLMYAEVTSPGLRLTLKGLELRNGAALIASGLDDSAGAIYFRPPGGVLTIEACSFLNNKALFLGGAIRTKNTGDLSVPGITLIIRDSVFEKNTAQFGGAASVGTRATVEVERSVFTRNSVQAAADFSSGGALSCYGTMLTVKDTSFESNFAGNAGGALDVFSTCPGDFGPGDTFQQVATATLSNAVLTRNQAGVNPSPVSDVFGGAISSEGCTFATPVDGTPLPRTSVRLSDSRFDANAALGTDGFGGAYASAYGVSTLVVASEFSADADSCSKDGAFYINLFSSEANGCTDTLSVQAEVAPPCDAWMPLSLIHKEAGSQEAGTRQTCVSLQPAKDSAFCCAPSVAAPALVCPVAPPVPSDLTCAVAEPREANNAAKNDIMARMIAAKTGSAMD